LEPARGNGQGCGLELVDAFDIYTPAVNGRLAFLIIEGPTSFWLDPRFWLRAVDGLIRSRGKLAVLSDREGSSGKVLDLVFYDPRLVRALASIHLKAIVDPATCFSLAVLRDLSSPSSPQSGAIRGPIPAHLRHVVDTLWGN
jgi:hypothetical protein